MEWRVWVVVLREPPLQRIVFWVAIVFNMSIVTVTVTEIEGSKELGERFDFGFPIIQQSVVEHAQIPHNWLFSVLVSVVSSSSFPFFSTDSIAVCL